MCTKLNVHTTTVVILHHMKKRVCLLGSTIDCSMCFTGKTLSVRVMRDERGHSRGFGFVNFENHEDAQKV